MSQSDTDRILQLVEKHGVTAYKMAQETGLTEQGIGKILSGKTQPRRTTTKLILDYLNKFEGVSKEVTSKTEMSEMDKEAFKEEVNKIVSRRSELPIEERESILIEALLIEKDKVQQLYELNTKPLLQELREIYFPKKKK